MTLPKLTPAQRAKAVDLVRYGIPQADVARRYGVAHSVICLLVKQAKEAQHAAA